jgi:ethanolamine utilization protein EutP (predicted NTPase)
MNELKFKQAETKTIELFGNIKKLKSEIKNEEVKLLFDELDNKLSELEKKIKVEIAFVGQYSAGKSTIISAISGNKGIKIGQDITTDVPQPYPWGSILLIDTPGIYAGRPDHDKASIEYMNKADLLVYVITTQGFTAETAKNFKQLAFEENRADKIMLLINKSSQGDREVSESNWISDALMVTEPKTADDLFLCVIDAKDYLEASEFENESDRKDMITYSGFDQFLNNLNQFLAEKGILGRLITPINLAQDYLNQIIDQLTAGNEDTKNMLELLNRKYFRLIKSENNITGVVNGHIDSLVSKIKDDGNKIANLIEKDGDSETLKLECENSVERIQTWSDDFSKKIESAIESEFTQLSLELDVLLESEVAKTLLNQKSINIKFNTNINLNSINKEKLTSGIQILNNFSTFAKGFTVNTKAVKAAADAGKTLKGLKVISGSEGHKVIYNIGKFFGKKFKPYGAVKAASKLGKIGSIVGKVTIVLPFLVAGFEEYQENRYAKKIKEERQKVRDSYGELAREIKSSFGEQFDKLLEESYRLEIANTQKIMEGIRDSDKLKDSEVVKIQRLLEKSSSILKELR